ncbi:hypothetical protein O3M35_000614 [Rhynocoris fuscipes]|uniref:Uncharacterized protein n=1 Tax=Rhynocoris fuscipes TaxID=488301 RepID=A0AAW1DPC2_9HEMI
MDDQMYSLIELIDKKNIERDRDINKLLEKLSAMNQITAAINSMWCKCNESENKTAPPRSFCRPPSSADRPHFSIDTIINDLKLMINDLDKDEPKYKKDKIQTYQSMSTMRPSSRSMDLVEPTVQSFKESCIGCSAIRGCTGTQCRTHGEQSFLPTRETSPSRCNCQCTKYNGLQDRCEGYRCINKSCKKTPIGDPKEGWIYPTIPCDRNRDSQVKSYPLLWEYPQRVAQTRRCLLKELIEKDLLVGGESTAKFIIA